MNSTLSFFRFLPTNFSPHRGHGSPAFLLCRSFNDSICFLLVAIPEITPLGSLPSWMELYISPTCSAENTTSVFDLINLMLPQTPSGSFSLVLTSASGPKKMLEKIRESISALDNPMCGRRRLRNSTKQHLCR